LILNTVAYRHGLNNTDGMATYETNLFAGTSENGGCPYFILFIFYM
jgi:hypothetical protein